MCGIAGIWNLNGEQVKLETLHIFQKMMHHRGPDDQHSTIEGNVGLAFCRLSILDLSDKGRQPMYSEDRQHVLIFNGEIYNYRELRFELEHKGVIFHGNADSEVLLNALVIWGDEALDKIKGMFSFAFLNLKKQTLLLVRDRFGIKPLYYVQTNDFFAFASEIKPLLSILPGKPKANSAAIANYLYFGKTDVDQQTFFKTIFQLKPGHLLRLDFSQKEIPEQKCWYTLKPKPFKGEKREELKKMLGNTLAQHLQSDVPLGVTLSGGLDSSIIASIAIEQTEGKTIRAFSAVFDNFKYSEKKFVDLYEASLDLHFVQPNGLEMLRDLPDFIQTMEEPIPTTSAYAQYRVMKEANRFVKVVLSGQGADEQFAGYHYFFGFYFKELLFKGKMLSLFKELWYYFKIQKSFFAFYTFLYLLLPEKARVRLSTKNLAISEKWKEKNKAYLVNEELYGSQNVQEAMLNHFRYKLVHLLKWEDKNSMRFSIESRVPFLDHELVELALGLPSSVLIHKGNSKVILRETFSDILPREIAERTDKIGYFTPEGSWFRSDEWKGLIFSILNSGSFAKRGIIDPAKAIRIYKRHLKGSRDYSKQIWKWINLELWFQTYIDEKQ